MESPLTQQARPDAFEPKIVQHYLYLFTILPNENEDETLPSEGFWRELFLLKPDKRRLSDILDPLTANDLLHIQFHTRLFFQRAISEAGSGIAPRNENALEENLAGFLGAVFTKRFTNPSTDIIDVLAGLDKIDKLISDLVSGLEAIIRQGTKPEFRSKAITTALSMVAGGFQTSLVTYYMHRDLFPPLMKYIHDIPDSSLQAFILLGILANYNKFESQNVYQNRLEDFVNEDTISLLVRKLTSDWLELRNSYVAIQDDSPVPWTLNSTLNLVGLRALSSDAKKPVPPTEEEAKALFSALPTPSACFTLSVYSFIQANKIFALNLLTQASESGNETPFSAFLSATSYLTHHAFRGSRPSHYAVLNLLTIRMLVEDQIMVKRICSVEAKATIRLCRQRPPHLPLITSSRVPATAILDICTDILSHNLRKRLDIQLYSLSLGIILRIFTHLDHTKTRLQHHWAYIWGSLLSLIRFLTQYAADFQSLRGIREELCSTLTNLLAFSLTKGDSFLPDPMSYDDLFYKVIETAEIMPKFKQAYCDNNSISDSLTRATNALLTVSSHYHNLLASQHGRKTHQSPVSITKVIKDGYETLNLDADENFGRWERWRESTAKTELKKIIRSAVDDARILAMS